MIKQLFPGEHQNTKFDGGYVIDPVTSGPVLIQNSDDKWILVDPGAFSYKNKLLAELAFHGLVPADIDAVFNTHHHLDHTSNNFLFSDYCPIFTRSALLWPNGKTYIYKDPEAHRLEWPTDIELIPTPGHTFDHVSFVYREEGKTYVCAGDAIREDMIRGESKITAQHPEPYAESLKKIFEIADTIFPGHGRVIEGKLLEELKEVFDAKS